MTSRVAARLAGLNTTPGRARAGSLWLKGSLLRLPGRSRPDVYMDRITFVVTGVGRNDQDPEVWLRAARGEAPVSRYGE